MPPVCAPPCHSYTENVVGYHRCPRPQNVPSLFLAHFASLPKSQLRPMELHTARSKSPRHSTKCYTVFDARSPHVFCLFAPNELLFCISAAGQSKKSTGSSVDGTKTGLVKTWKYGEGGPLEPPPTKAGGVGKRAERLFWAVRVQAKDEGYCISHSDACVCSHALHVVFHCSMVPVVCSTSPDPGPERSKHSCQCGYAIVSPELPNSSCQRRTGPCRTQKTLRASDRAIIHRVKGVCPWSPLQGGGGLDKGLQGPPAPPFQFFSCTGEQLCWGPAVQMVEFWG